MKSKKSSILILHILLLILPRAFSQDISTEGTDFWVSFMGNGFDSNNNGGDPYLKTQVLISSLYNCSGVVSNPNTGWSAPFSVVANGVAFIDIPKDEAYMKCNDYTTPLAKSVRIVAEQPVSVYCANAARYSFDASYVLPTPALADNYIIQTYDQSPSTTEHTSAFLIIAVDEGETTVDITPTVKTLDGKPANQTFSITLQQGQVYQVRSHNQYSLFSPPSRDLSGSRVASRNGKKIAVFNGNTLTMVPTDGYDSDCIFEQAMPVQAWGKQFVVTASLNRENKDYVKITSASNNNEIIVNGQYYYTLSANESKSFMMQETSYFIEASSQCAVYLYNHSKDGTPNSSTGFGAPSMVWIAPIEQRINELAFNTFNDLDPEHVSVDKHYVNIIVESDNVGNVILDGNPIPESQFSPVIGSSFYKFSRKEINHGAHHLSCEGGFNAHVYGFGNATGYAYMVGSKAADIAEDQFIHHDTIANACDSFEWCDSTYFISGQYIDTVTEGLIHDIYQLDLNLHYSPTPRISCATSGAVVFGPTHDTVAVVTNTEFFSFQYDFFVEDSLGHFDDWDSCVWQRSKESWLIEPFTKEEEPNRCYCRVYVAEPDDTPVELSCTVYNSHCDPHSITRRIYLKPSFFGFEGNEIVQSNFSVVPNPNNGEMDLRFEHLTGNINVKVYDIHGTLIDNIVTYNELESKTIHHSLGNAPSSIYFFIATAKEGTIAKKVIIELNR